MGEKRDNYFVMLLSPAELIIQNLISVVRYVWALNCLCLPFCQVHTENNDISLK